jgi:hypothetical protein
VSTTLHAIRDRVTSVCVGTPFFYTHAQTPFSFDLEPSSGMAACCRIEASIGSVIGGFNYSEERTDALTIWLARAHQQRPTETYQDLLTDANSIRSAVIRDGAASGEYFVPADGASGTPEQETGREYAVLRMTLPVNYEAVV